MAEGKFPGTRMVGHRAPPGQADTTTDDVYLNMNKHFSLWRWLYQSDPVLWGVGESECVLGIYGHLCLQFLHQ